MVIMRMRPGQALELVERQVVLFAASEGGQIMVMMAMLVLSRILMLMMILNKMMAC